MTDLTAYRGQWVATRGAQLLAAGDEAVDVYHAALAVDPAERFILHRVANETSAELRLAPLWQRLGPLLNRADRPVYIVGGAVRDALLGRLSHDVDFVVPTDALDLTFRLADALEAPAYALDAGRDTGRIVLPVDDTTVDVAGYRGDDLFADLRDRDFTVNAMALPVNALSRASLIDPLNGLADLEARTLRLTQPSALENDALRALRAVRLAAELDFTLASETEAAVARMAPRLPQQTSAERLRDELIKIIDGPRTAAAVEQMHALGLLAAILPEIEALAPVPQSPPHYERVLAHTVSVLRWLEYLQAGLSGQAHPSHGAVTTALSALAPYRDVLTHHLSRTIDGGIDGGTVIGLAALFHDVGKRETMTWDEDGRYRFFGHAEIGEAMTASRLRALCFSNEAVNQTSRIVTEHMRPLLLAEAQGGDLTRRAAYRFFKACGANGLDVVLLSLADHLASHDGPGDDNSWPSLLALTAALLDFYFNQFEETVKPPALVDGRDLMAYLQIPPGPEIGRLLGLIEENQAAGLIHSADEALLFAREAYASGA